MDLDPKRPSVSDIMEDYWKLLPEYQGVPLEQLTHKRVLFGLFTSYKDSPLPAVDSAEVLELGESTAGPSRQPSGSLEERDRIDDFFAQGKDQDFQCTVR